MEMSEQINELADALSRAQGELKNVSKDKEGLHGSKYADLASVLEATRQSLSNHGLAIIQSAGSTGEQVSVTTTLMHKSGQWVRDTITMPVQAGGGMSRAQAVGMVITYARRYSLAAFVGIAQEDNDAAHEDHEQPQQRQQTPKPAYTIQQAQQNMPGWKEKGLTADSMVNKIKTKYTLPAEVEAYIRQELGAAAE